MKKTVKNLLIFISVLTTAFIPTGCKKNQISPSPVKQQGKIVYYNFSTATSAIDVWTANYDGSDAKKINIGLPVNEQLFLGLPPKMSVDGQSFYLSGISSDGSKWSIFLCNIDGTNLKEIITGDGYSYLTVSDTYTTNGKAKILYTQNSNYRLGIWTANSDGTSAQKLNLTLPAGFQLFSSFPKITPDGSTVFFVAEQTLAQYMCYIYAYNIAAATTKNVMLADTTSNVQHLSLDLCNVYPSGKSFKLLYFKEFNVDQIWTFNLDGTGLQSVHPGNIAIAPGVPKVSPDGKTIFFNGGVYSDLTTTYSCNIDGSNVHAIISPSANGIPYLGDVF